MYAALLPDAQDEHLPRLLDALAERGDPLVAPAVMSLMAGQDVETIQAAIRALGSVGDATCVPSLARLASAGNTDARTSLHSNRQPGFDTAIGQALTDEPDSALRAVLARALGVRRAMGEVDPLLAVAARDPSLEVRMAALDSLETLAGEAQLARLVRITVKVAGADEAAAAVDAVVATCGRVEEGSARTAPILAALDGTGARGRESLIRILGRIGGPQALFAVRDDLATSGPVGEAAREVIAVWPDADAAEALLQITRETTEPTQREAAFTGLVHTASMPDAHSPEDATALLRAALELAETDSMRRTALEGVAHLAHPDALAMAEPFLTRVQVRREAALALVSIAHAVGEGNYDQGKDAIEMALRACPEDEEVKRRAGEALNHLERNADYVTDWSYAGPYRQDDTDGTGIFDVPFPPEPGGPEGTVEWSEIPAEALVSPGWVDIQKLASGGNACVYFETRITATRAAQARLEIGSDDGIVVWLNGERVHANNVMRGMTLGSDVFTVELREGANSLLLKVTQGGGDWRFGCRIRSADGHHLEGLRIEVPH